jgi:DMSO/TMAO reductase YedYZ molybdopterin-dependent catalytic subunit
MRRTRIQSPNLQRPVPPGQVYVDAFPIYDITPRRPVFDPATWRFRVWGAVERPVEWTWDELLRLPTVEVVADFHCVTRWSKRALVWEGIPVEVLLEQVQPRADAVQVMAHSMEGYTTNVPLEYLRREDSLLALRLNGEPLTPEHGAPLRLVVPQLYAWKSAKYLCGLEFQTDWVPGFWEQRGYHWVGDPWEEQRYWEPIEQVRAWWRRVRVSRVER